MINEFKQFPIILLKYFKSILTFATNLQYFNIIHSLNGQFLFLIILISHNIIQENDTNKQINAYKSSCIQNRYIIHQSIILIMIKKRSLFLIIAIHKSIYNGIPSFKTSKDKHG
jgi:hypothetical protein